MPVPDGSLRDGSSTCCRWLVFGGAMQDPQPPSSSVPQGQAELLLSRGAASPAPAKGGAPGTLAHHWSEKVSMPLKRRWIFC